MKTSNIKTYIGSLAFLLNSFAQAAIIRNSPDNEARLGHGIKVATEQLYPSCIRNFSPKDVVSEDALSNDHMPAGTLRLEVTSEVIRSYQKLDEYLNESISANVQYMAYSGSAQYSHEKQTSLSSDQITVGIRAKADFGRWYLKNPEIKTELQSVGKSNPQKFYQTCGTEFVSGYRLGQGLNIVLRTLETSSYSYEKIQAGATASAKFASGGGSVQAAFLNVASSLLKFGSLEVRIIGYGTGGLATTAEIIKTPKDVEKIVEIISDMLKQMDSKQSVITEYLTSPYPIQYQPYMAIAGEAQKTTLNDLYGAFRKVDSDLSRMRQYVAGSLVHDMGDLCNIQEIRDGKEMSCAQYAEYVQAQTEALDKARTELVAGVQRCANGNGIEGCKLTDLKVYLDLADQVRLWPGQYQHKLRVLKYVAELRARIEKEQNEGTNVKP